MAAFFSVTSQEALMNWDSVEGNWRQLTGKIKEQWGKLTDDDITAINGRRDQLEGKLQEHYGDPRALRICLELPSNEAVRAAVEAGLGATAISASVAAPSIEAGLLHQVRFRLREREFNVLHHRNVIRPAPRLRCWP
jgi:uncharacterized protein YjbJ (UPF0337 family)